VKPSKEDTMPEVSIRIALMALLALAAPAFAGGIAATLYKNPGCGCCGEHAKYLRAHGIEVTEVETAQLARLRRALGVPDHLAGCHLIRIGPYVFEGHLPAESIAQVLRDRPPIRGLSVPGMPPGSPGMTGIKQGPLHVYHITDETPPRLYASY
jgi:hypothetical protein